MIALGMLIEAAFGSGTYVSGVPATQTTVPSLNVALGRGSIVALEPLEATAFGSLAADTSDLIMKQGRNITTQVACAAPLTSGQSINYLIEASFLETDTGSAVLSYVDAANPAVPYAGPANAGTSQNTRRQQFCQVQAKAGTAATTGTQTTPAVDSGWVPLYVVTVAYGQTAITNSQIAVAPGAPFLRTQRPFYQTPATLSTTTANNSNYTLVSQQVTFPMAAPTGGFRVKAHGILNGNTTNATQQNFQLSISDGTNVTSGVHWLVFTNAAVGAAVESTFFLPTIYSPGQVVTFTLNLTTSGGGAEPGQMAMSTAQLDLQVEYA